MIRKYKYLFCFVNVYRVFALDAKDIIACTPLLFFHLFLTTMESGDDKW